MHWTHVFLIVIFTIVITIAGTYWILKTYIFPTAFIPVVLDTKEERTLQEKLQVIGYDSEFSAQPKHKKESTETSEDGFLEPEPYSEKGAPRQVSFTERELNALLAKNTDLSQRLAIDFASNLISAKFLLPLEKDFPVLGGKTLRFNAGLGMAYLHDKPVVVLKGASIMGIPIPNAWLGGLKNIDLVSEFGIEPGFWKSFSEGIEDIQVTDGQISIKLKE